MDEHVVSSIEEDDPLSIRLDDLEPVSICFDWKGKKYVLREASEDAAAKYRNAVQRSFRMNQEGSVVAMDGNADTQSLLVSLCVFELNPQGSKAPEGPVSVGWVRSLPHKMVKRLFEKAERISELSEGDEETIVKQIAMLTKRLAKMREGKGTTPEGNAKNGPDGTTPTFTMPTS